MPQAYEVRPPQRLCEDVGHVVSRLNTGDFDFLLLNKLPDGVELNPDMFDRRVASLILSKAESSIVVAVQWGWFLGEEAEAV